MADGPTTWAELMERQRAGRRRWEALLAAVPADRLGDPGVSGVLSVKDIVAHIAAWERHATERLRAVARDTEPEPLPQGQAWAEYEHAFNERVLREWRARSWDEVRAEAADAYARFLAAAESVREDVLFGSDQRWQTVAFNGYLHYLDFADAIKSWLAE